MRERGHTHTLTVWHHRITEQDVKVTVCVCVSGIESLVRSLKEALRLTNVEVQRQGLLLLTEILER